MFDDYKISEITNEDFKKQSTEQILRLLPDWFGDEDSLVDYVKTISELPFFAAFSNNQCVGFFAGLIHHGRTGDIYVCGIHPEHHNRGLGKKLYFELEQYFINNGCDHVMVKTLSPLRPSVHYNRTREFYHAVGFNDFYTNHEIWGKKNPCLIMVKNLNKY